MIPFPEPFVFFGPKGRILPQRFASWNCKGQIGPLAQDTDWAQVSALRALPLREEFIGTAKYFDDQRLASKLKYGFLLGLADFRKDYKL
ncbi:hypothetical protein [Maribacter sp. 2307ULW6-5]|uniref:hypothetical protein n=1 Tax=Maribacter sp. 2307ULW6-5 TaxID=3386275 RepID=UPI0039BC7E89